MISKEKNITVIGIGKLGLCFALMLEKNGYNVTGCDISESYVKELNKKVINTDEPFVTELLLNSKNFKASTNLLDAILFSNIIFIIVATPSLNNGRYDHSQIDFIISQIKKFQAPKMEKHLFISCTVMPGYIDIISKKIGGLKYIVSYNPEFIAQGSIIRDIQNPDIVLIGADNKNAQNILKKIYSKICLNKPLIHTMSPKEAEITKIALNCFLTTKIAYANMIGDLARSVGADESIILNAIGSDSRVGNFFLKYGYGFGGPCLPRDNRALLSFADDHGYNALISKYTDMANKEHLDFQINEFCNCFSKKETVNISGLAYKAGTNILEESQKLEFAVRLAQLGYRVELEDNELVLEEIKAQYQGLFSYRKI